MISAIGKAEARQSLKPVDSRLKLSRELTLVIPAFRRQRQKDHHKFKASLIYIPK